MRCRGDSRSGKNFFQFAGANHRINFRHISANFIVKTLDQASGDYQALRLAVRLVASHFQNCVDGFLLCAGNKGAGIHDDHVSISRVWSKFGTALGEHTHHDLAINEILRAAQAHKTYFCGSRWLQVHGNAFFSWHREFYCRQVLLEGNYVSRNSNIWREALAAWHPGRQRELSSKTELC